MSAREGSRDARPKRRDDLRDWRTEFLSLPRRKRWSDDGGQDRFRRVQRLMRPAHFPPIKSDRNTFWQEAVDAIFRPISASDRWREFASEVFTRRLVPE